MLSPQQQIHPTSILSTTVKNALCCGCGICSALCPQNALKMQFNNHGEYNPTIIGVCNDCGRCQHTCPFEDKNPNEDEIGKELYGTLQYRKETGYFLSSYVGYITHDSERWKSASGGLASTFLKELLNTGIAEKIVCVRKATATDNKLYEFFVAETIDDINSSRGSAYYPTEMSGVLQYILEHEGKYAIIALPCFVKGLRLAQKNSKKLRDRIVCIAGLTCGHMKCTKFTKLIAHIGGMNEEIASVHYRCKSEKRSAGQFSFEYLGKEGGSTSVSWDNISPHWSNESSNVPACNFCDDIFAECADVTFMDAWLPEYSQDSRGTSLCIVRSKFAKDILLNDSTLTLLEISIDKVIESQQGVVNNKRKKLSYRLLKRKKEGVFIPQKRVKPATMGGIPYLTVDIMTRGIAFGISTAGKVLRKMGHR